MGLTNHTHPTLHHITPLVMNDLLGRHTHTHARIHAYTYARTHTHTYIPTHEQEQFEETRHARLLRKS